MIKDYKQLMAQHGCAACIHRGASWCMHPKAPNQSILGGDVKHYVVDSLDTGASMIRPHWCPYPSSEWALPSEMKES